MGCGVILAIAETREQIGNESGGGTQRTEKVMREFNEDKKGKVVLKKEGNEQQYKVQVIPPASRGQNVQTVMIKVNGKEDQSIKNRQQIPKKKQDQKKVGGVIYKQKIESKQQKGVQSINKAKTPTVQKKQTFQKKQKAVVIDQKQNDRAAKPTQQKSIKESQIDGKNAKVIDGQHTQRNSLPMKLVSKTSQIKSEKSQLDLKSPRDKRNNQSKIPQKKNQSIKSPRAQVQSKKNQNIPKKVSQKKQAKNSPKAINTKDKEAIAPKKIQEAKIQINQSPTVQKKDDKQEIVQKQIIKPIKQQLKPIKQQQKLIKQQQKKDNSKLELKKTAAKRQSKNKSAIKIPSLTPAQQKKNKQREEISKKIYGNPQVIKEVPKQNTNKKVESVISLPKESNKEVEPKAKKPEPQMPVKKEKITQNQTNKVNKKTIQNKQSLQNLNEKQKSKQNSAVNKTVLGVPRVSNQPSKQNSIMISKVDLSNQVGKQVNKQKSTFSKKSEGKSKASTKNMIPVESLFFDSDLISKDVKTKNNINDSKEEDKKLVKDTFKQNQPIKRTSKQQVKDGSGEGKNKTTIKIQENAAVLENVELNSRKEGASLKECDEAGKQKGIQNEKLVRIEVKENETSLVLQKS